MPYTQKVSEWLDSVGSLWAWFIALGSAALLAWRWVFSAISSVTFYQCMVTHFGSDPAQVLADLVEAIQRDDDEAAVRYELLSEAAGLGFYSCDTSGQCISCDKYVAEIWGMSVTDMLGSGWLAGIDPSRQVAVYDDWMASVERGLIYSHHYNVTNQRTKKTVKVFTQAKPIKREGEIVRYVGTVKVLKDS